MATESTVSVTIRKVQRKTAPLDTNGNPIPQSTVNSRVLGIIGEETQHFDRRDGSRGSRTMPLLALISLTVGREDRGVFYEQVAFNPDRVFPRWNAVEGLDVIDGKAVDAESLMETAMENAANRFSSRAAQPSEVTLDDLAAAKAKPAKA